VPLFEIPLSILKKYENHPVCSLQQKLLPVPSNQKLNGYLKEISDLCGIKKNLSSHSARHTFATTVTLGNGLNLKSISGMMGHSSTKMTEKYARSNEQLICKEMSKIDGRYKAYLTSLVTINIPCNEPGMSTNAQETFLYNAINASTYISLYWTLMVPIWTCNKNMDNELSHAALFRLFNSLPYSNGDKKFKEECLLHVLYHVWIYSKQIML
jgi:hypothetical protein